MPAWLILKMSLAVSICLSPLFIDFAVWGIGLRSGFLNFRLCEDRLSEK